MLHVGEALVLNLGMWPKCFAHTRGCAGAVLRGLRAAGWGCESPLRPAPLAGVPAARCLGRRATGCAARPLLGPALPAPARPGAPGDGRRHGTPAPRLPAGRGGAPLPKGPPRRAGRGGREGGDHGCRGRRCAWPAARPSISPAAGRGTGLTCSLSSAIESVHPGFLSDSLHNMQNMQQTCRICGKYAAYTLKYAEYAIKYVQ